MAPLLRLANELALAAEESVPSRYLARVLKHFSSTLRTGPQRIAQHFRSALRRGDKKIITTYSYSSTVLQAIVAAHSPIWQVICSEGRPGLEGRKIVEQILRRGKGIGASLTTDAALHLFTAHSHALVVGADSLEEARGANRVPGLGARGYIEAASAGNRCDSRRPQRSGRRNLAKSAKAPLHFESLLRKNALPAGHSDPVRKHLAHARANIPRDKRHQRFAPPPSVSRVTTS